MKIGIFTDTYLPQINGVVTSIETFRREYEKRGHEVYIFAPKAPDHYKDSKYIFRFDSIKFPQNPDYRISSMLSPELLKFAKLKLDIIHTQDPFSLGVLGMMLARYYKIPLVHTYHTFYEKYVHYLPMPQKYSVALAKKISKSFCNKHNLIIAPSAAMKKVLEDYQIKKPIVVAPTGIDLEKVKELIPAEEICKKYQIKDPSELLVFAGRLGKEKNIDFLFGVLIDILVKFPKARLFVLGDGTERKNLETLAKKLGIADKVTFTGFLDQKNAFSIVKASRVFVFASTTETQGLVVAEAMACGTPVVAVNEMGVIDVLEGDKGGFGVRLDKKEFTQAVAGLLGDKKIWQKKHKEALLRAKEFSSGAMAEAILGYYQKLIEAGKYFYLNL